MKIDLSKVKVGQKVKRKDGKIVVFNGKTGNVTFPYEAGINSYTKAGTYWQFSASQFDIIAILPLKSAKKPKTKAKSKPRKKLSFHQARAILLENIENRRLKNGIKAAIKLLQNLLK